jgi:hypothetical protein
MSTVGRQSSRYFTSSAALLRNQWRLNMNSGTLLTKATDRCGHTHDKRGGDGKKILSVAVDDGGCGEDGYGEDAGGDSDTACKSASVKK